MRRYARTVFRGVTLINLFWRVLVDYSFILVGVCYVRGAFLYFWFDLVNELFEQSQLLVVVCDVGFRHF